MVRKSIDFPETVSKVVDSFRVYADEGAGREVHIIFTDGTAISISIDASLSTIGRIYRVTNGDIEVLRERSDV